MKTEELLGLAERHDDHIARVKALDKVIISFKAPCCGKDIETPAAPAGQSWSTLATCQHCGELYKKFTDGEHAFGLTLGGK